MSIAPMRSRRLLLVGSLGTALVACARPAPAVQQPPAIGIEVENDTTPMLAARRIAALPESQRAAWTRYIETSRRLRAADQESMSRELASIGQQKMTKAPEVRASFDMRPWMSGAWLGSDSARRLANAMLSYQTAASGGWSKHVDFEQGPRKPGQSYFSETDAWSYIATLDNNSTTSEMELLAGVYGATNDARYRDGFLRGLEFLLTAQFPTGCWPQVYPLQGGYHDAATFNDDATINALEILRGAANGTYAFVPAEQRARADAAAKRAIDCIVNAQVVDNGKRAGWGQQHDPISLAPVTARSYELAGISGRESASIMEFLMSLPDPDSRVIAAVHATADWFRRTAIMGYEYRFDTGLTVKPGADPIWARLTELGTDRPIFSNRDGVKLYDWNQLTDRRTGYAWYGTEPGSALKKYEKWVKKHPRPSS
jgi:PelA/Pel-15E family pectate lyase